LRVSRLQEKTAQDLIRPTISSRLSLGSASEIRTDSLGRERIGSFIY
jgi:hypothetical protein